MKSILVLPIIITAVSLQLVAQNNILFTNPQIDEILEGNYDPVQYQSSDVIDNPHAISRGIQSMVNPDSLYAYLLELSSFGTRNTGSDTLSVDWGIGAARRWVHSKFAQFDQENEDRLEVGYLQFDQTICGMTRHRNVVAVLPGSNLNYKDVILIEAHMDSRCDTSCDVDCTAEGMEDNGSGTALVIELARIMSRYTFDRTIIFMTTTGEEQGLLGANALAEYMDQNEIEIRAVYNNDIVGGILCGKTASPPGCPGPNDVDSTQVRIYSAGTNNSANKQLGRFVKMQYQDEVLGHTNIPMQITLMSGEDRSGRGGDHIPFRQRGYPAIRFTSANEHGNANTSDPDYCDRQHTSEDILGVDTDGDSVLDSFFVDFNYLSRNALINGNAATMAAQGPVTPETHAYKLGDSIHVDIIDPNNYGEYLVLVRQSGHEFTQVIPISGTTHYSFFSAGHQHVSSASIDADGVESTFSNEIFTFLTVDVEEPDQPESKITLLQNRPNPFDEATYISYVVPSVPQYRKAYLQIYDPNGRLIMKIPVALEEGMNEILYRHGYGLDGQYIYALVVDGKFIDSKRMVFSN